MGSRQIRRRDFLERAGTVSAGLFLTDYGRVTEGSSSQVQAGGKKPNILFVFADQLRYSALGSSGNRVVRTPNFDRLASEGLVFENAFANHPLCSPYRANLLTGKYGFANGVPDNEYVLWDNQVTLAQGSCPACRGNSTCGRVTVNDSTQRPPACQGCWSEH